MLYQVLVMILPFITAPYLARVIGKEGTGIYSYTYSISHYFVLFSLMGLSNYGNRTIAKIRNDKEKRNKVFSSIYVMQLMFATFSLILYAVVIAIFEEDYKILFIIQSLNVLSAAFDVSWFFFGMEQFKMMVLRNTFVKLVTVILIFCYVKEASDLWKYTLIMSCGTLLSQVYLWFQIPKYVVFKVPKMNDVIKHIKPNLILFIPVIAVSLYRIMDKIMLGTISTMEQTGLYENADKLVTIPITIISSIGTVMMPKMANIYANGKNKKSKKIFRDSMQLVLFISIAMTFGLIAIAEKFVPLYYGNEFIECVKLIKLMSPILIFDSIANVVRTQYLIPKCEDNIYILSVILGAIVNLIVNSICIPKMGAIGAAWGTVGAEFVVMFTQCAMLGKKLELKKYFLDNWMFLLSGIFMYIIVKGIDLHSQNTFTALVAEILVGCIVYVVFSAVIFFIFKKERFYYLKSVIMTK